MALIGQENHCRVSVETYEYRKQTEKEMSSKKSKRKGTAPNKK